MPESKIPETVDELRALIKDVRTKLDADETLANRMAEGQPLNERQQGRGATLLAYSASPPDLWEC